MYYIPSPDLSRGVERNVPQLEERNDVEELEVVYSQDEYFTPSIEDEHFRPSIEVFRPDLAIGTNIEGTLTDDILKLKNSL